MAIDVYGITESGKKVKVGQVDESQVLNPVGGTIFYIDDTADGTYSFYDSNGNSVSAPSVGSDYTGYYYTVNGATKDKYYIRNDNAVFFAGNGTQESPSCCWTYLDEANQSYIDNTEYTSGGAGNYTYLGKKGRVYETSSDMGTTSNAIGVGKNNTNVIMNIKRNVTVNGVTTFTNAYVQEGCAFMRDSDEPVVETHWNAIKKYNNNNSNLRTNTTGLNDWYAPSMAEAEALANSFTNITAFRGWLTPILEELAAEIIGIHSTISSGTQLSFWTSSPSTNAKAAGLLAINSGDTISKLNTQKPTYSYFRETDTGSFKFSSFILLIRSF